MSLFRRLCVVLAVLLAVGALVGCAPRHRQFCFREGGGPLECVSTAYRGSGS